jgi:hypothetical protein|tara:strand:- start:107 stop:349 length:243 start_codon:yes stop_codon:yes gene_type:complete
MDKEEMMIVYSAIQGLESREESLLLGTLVDSAKQILKVHMSDNMTTEVEYNDGPISIMSTMADAEMQHALLVAKALEEEE